MCIKTDKLDDGPSLSVFLYRVFGYNGIKRLKFDLKKRGMTTEKLEKRRDIHSFVSKTECYELPRSTESMKGGIVRVGENGVSE